MQTFCRVVEKEILTQYTTNYSYQNKTFHEKSPIQELSKDKDIIIKPVNKVQLLYRTWFIIKKKYK